MHPVKQTDSETPLRRQRISDFEEELLVIWAVPFLFQAEDRAGIVVTLQVGAGDVIDADAVCDGIIVEVRTKLCVVHIALFTGWTVCGIFGMPFFVNFRESLYCACGPESSESESALSSYRYTGAYRNQR